MRSQKQNNRTPRPFKTGRSERGWSGGRQHKAQPPPVKSILAAAKPASVDSAVKSDETPPAAD